jgi:hypothetical protein
MIDWLTSGGAQFTHLKMQFYEENYRGVHARLKISVIYINFFFLKIFIFATQKGQTTYTICTKITSNHA